MLQGKHFPILFFVVLLGSGCTSYGFLSGMGGGSRVLARDDEFVVVKVGRDDSRALAKRFLGDEDRYWVIEDANPPKSIKPGHEIVIPL